jgi:hypothetical protein
MHCAPLYLHILWSSIRIDDDQQEDRITKWMSGYSHGARLWWLRHNTLEKNSLNFCPRKFGISCSTTMEQLWVQPNTQRLKSSDWKEDIDRILSKYCRWEDPHVPRRSDTEVHSLVNLLQPDGIRVMGEEFQETIKKRLEKPIQNWNAVSWGPNVLRGNFC